MAYDPQNPLDAITGERAKRGKKNQSTFEDRNKVTVGGPAGKPMQVQGKREPGGLMSVSYEDLAKAAEQQRNPGASSMPPAPASTSPKEPSQPKLPPPGLVPKEPQLVAKKEPVAQVGPPSATRPRMDSADAMFGDTGLQTIGQLMRQPPPPQRGLTSEMNEGILRDVLAGEAQRLRQVKREDDALSRAFPDVSFRPKEQVEAAQKPVISERQEGFVGPERLSARNRADQLRAQIASEQQAMLKARRARGGSFTEDADQLQRIAGMRQELAQYERAGQPIQQIKVKTPEENLATEQNLARQASDIMSKDVEDLRTQVSTMPAGPERDAQAERLRSLEYQQQQQAARAGVLGAGAVGPQPMGASVGLAEQMMGEAQARTQRQREAAPRVAARQQELADVAMREGERLTGKRQDIEQQQKDFAEATRKAALSELSAPERMRQEAIATEQAKRAALTAETGIKTEESKARVAKIMSETKMTEAQAKAFDSQLSVMADNAKLDMQMKQNQVEAGKIANAYNKAKSEAATKGIAIDPEMRAMQDAAIKDSMNKMGIGAEDEQVVQQAAEGLKQNLDNKTYTVSSDAADDVRRASQINNYVRGLKSLYDQGGDARTIAISKAKRLASMFGGEITGQRTSVERALKNIGSAAAAGTAVGAGVGALGAGVGALPGAGAGAVIGTVAGTVASAVDAIAQRVGFTSEEVDNIKSKFNEAYQLLDTMSRGQ